MKATGDYQFSNCKPSKIEYVVIRCDLYIRGGLVTAEHKEKAYR